MCDTSLGLSGTRAYHCGWAFAYRSSRASETFNMLNRDIRRCLGPLETGMKDVHVNHPDSYDLRQYFKDGVTISLALKDKASLQKTYVLLRFTRQPDE